MKDEYNLIIIFEPRCPFSDNFHKSSNSQTKARAIPKVAVAYVGYYGINKIFFLMKNFIIISHGTSFLFSAVRLQMI